MGLQILTLLLTATFFLGMFYRSASLYHPQRRAIMHLKNQKRKIKMKKDDKTKLLEEKVPVIDLYVLKSKTIKILLSSTAVTSLGMNTPVFYLVRYFNWADRKQNKKCFFDFNVENILITSILDRAGQPRGLEAAAG